MKFELELIKWAVASKPSRDAPQPANSNSIDRNLLSLLVQRHNVAIRLLDAVEHASSESMRWCDRSIKLELLQQKASIRERTDIHVEAFREIKAVYGADLIPFKGFTIDRWMQRTRNQHLSGDLDLICDDPERLYEVVTNLGYAGRRFDYDYHEFANVERDGVLIDIHRYFPVWSYPTAAFDPIARSDGAIPSRYMRSDIKYADFARHVVPPPCDYVDDIGIPDPTFDVLLLCAHEFRTYLQPFFAWQMPIGLGMLADIRDLMQLREFDSARLLALTANFRGWDSVRFVGKMLTEFFEDNILEMLVDDIEAAEFRPYFPRPLTFGGPWEVISTPEELLLPLQITQVVEHLETQTIVATRGGPRSHYVSDYPADATQFLNANDHTIQTGYRYPQGRKSPLRLSAAIGRQYVFLTLHLADLDIGSEYEIYAFYHEGGTDGFSKVELIYGTDADHKWSCKGSHMGFLTETRLKECRVDLYLPRIGGNSEGPSWSRSDGFEAKAPVATLLSMTRRARGSSPYEHIEFAQVFPLLVVAVPEALYG